MKWHRLCHTNQVNKNGWCGKLCGKLNLFHECFSLNPEKSVHASHAMFPQLCACTITAAHEPWGHAVHILRTANGVLLRAVVQLLMAL
jgi:hypothetical protein